MRSNVKGLLALAVAVTAVQAAEILATVTSTGGTIYDHKSCWTKGSSTTFDALSDDATASNTMTVEKCANYCTDYKYFGVSNGRECYCGDSLAGSALQPASCNVACKGAPGEFCGGATSLNVYERAHALEIVPSSGEFEYQTCWTDGGSSSHALTDTGFSSTKMTVPKCADFCEGYTYFGVSGGNKCYCGDDINPATQEAESQGECNSPCTGASTTACGGANRVNLYKIPIASLPSSTVTSAASSTAVSTASSTEVASSTEAVSSTEAASSTVTSLTITSAASLSVAPSSTESSSAAPTSSALPDDEDCDAEDDEDEDDEDDEDCEDEEDPEPSSTVSVASSTSAVAPSTDPASSSAPVSSDVPSSTISSSDVASSTASSSSASSEAASSVTPSSSVVSSDAASSVTPSSSVVSSDAASSTSVTASSSEASSSIVSSSTVDSSASEISSTTSSAPAATSTACIDCSPVVRDNKFQSGTTPPVDQIWGPEDNLNWVREGFPYQYAVEGNTQEVRTNTAEGFNYVYNVCEGGKTWTCRGHYAQRISVKAGVVYKLFSEYKLAGIPVGDESSLIRFRGHKLGESQSIFDFTFQPLGNTNNFWATYTTDGWTAPEDAVVILHFQWEIPHSDSVMEIKEANMYAVACREPGSTLTCPSTEASSTASVVASTTEAASSTSSAASSSEIVSSSTTSSSAEPSTTSSATPTATPNPFPDVFTYSWSGCYEEIPGRLFKGKESATDTMTLEECATFCHSFPYFGVEYGRECFCGADPVASGGQLAPSITECNMPCAGNSTEICGAGNRLSVYHDPAKLGPSTGGSNLGSTKKGCYTETGAGRTLAAKGFGDDNLTLEGCAIGCVGYKYWGVEYGRECFCGNTIQPAAELKADSECNMVCAGNAAELCGAGNRIMVYERVSD